MKPKNPPVFWNVLTLKFRKENNNFVAKMNRKKNKFDKLQIKMNNWSMIFEVNRKQLQGIYFQNIQC